MSVLESTGVAPQVVIVGGGIAGLTAAYELQELARRSGTAPRITIIEADQRVGGKVLTEYPDGYIVEGGPDSFLRDKPWAADLCRRLGLGDELIGTNDALRGTYILRRGKLVRMPEGLQLIVPTQWGAFLRSPLISARGKLRMALDLVLPRRRGSGEESVAAFVRRRLGREALEVLAEPLLAGIYASAPEEQSIMTFARFRVLEEQHRSLIRGSRAALRKATNRSGSPFLTLRGGLGRLIEALEVALDDVEVLRGTPVEAVDTDEGGGFRVSVGDRLLRADALLLTTPAYVAADLLDRFAPEPARILREIRYVSTATVALSYRRGDVPHPLDAFGFVIPRQEKRRIFGCTWVSSKFAGRAPGGTALLRCFVGGAGREALLEGDDGALVAAARDELQAIMGIDAPPLWSRVFRWPRSNPQYDVGHAGRVDALYRACAAFDGIYVAGHAYEGVGIPDTIRQAQATAAKVFAFLHRGQPAAY